MPTTTTVIEIPYKTVLSSLKKGEKPCYRAIPLSNGTITLEQLISDVAQRIGVGEEYVRFGASVLSKAVIENVGNGFRIDLPDFGVIGFSIQGVFDAINSPMEKGRHRLRVNFTPKGKLAAALSHAVGRNITEGNRCRITSVMDGDLKTEGVIKSGDNIEVYAAGGTFLVDVNAEDEGCWLEDEDGEVVTFGTVTDSSATTLDATFATTPEPGNYKFVVATRGGLGPEYGVSVARRDVVVQ